MFPRRPRSPVDRAMRAVRRELFVPPDQRGHVERDEPLPIGFAQTISQPSLVAHMTEELALTAQSRVLEIGTGSGFQTAILAEIAAEVFTIERVPDLARAAEARLVGLGYRHLHFRLGDGALGWPEAAPFDAIIVTAAAGSLPDAWLGQLRPGGRLVTPLGDTADNQMLMLIEKDAAGAVRRSELGPVRFVPLITDPPR